MMSSIIAPHPFAHTILLTDIEQQFARPQPWQDRYHRLIQLSRQLPDLADELKHPQCELYGCENRAWLDVQLLPNGQLHFYGDSESRMVKGLLAILLTIIEGMTPMQLLSTDINVIFQQLHITQHLSPSRHRGLVTLIERSQTLANTFILD